MYAANPCSFNISLNWKTTTFPWQHKDSLVLTTPVSSLGEEFGLGILTQETWLTDYTLPVTTTVFPRNFYTLHFLDYFPRKDWDENLYTRRIMIKNISNNVLITASQPCTTCLLALSSPRSRTMAMASWTPLVKQGLTRKSNTLFGVTK